MQAEERLMARKTYALRQSANLHREKAMKRCTPFSRLFLSLFIVLTVMHLCPANGQAQELEQLRCAALEKIDLAFQEVADQEYTLCLAAEYLPECLRPLLYTIIEVAGLDVPTEQKLSALLHATGSDCSIYAIVWLVGLLISFVPYIGSVGGVLQAIGVMGLILCLLGVI